MMGTRLTHVAFDIETTGFETDAQVTVVGLCLPLGSRILVNTDQRPVDETRLEQRLAEHSGTELSLSSHRTETDLLGALATFLAETVAPRDYMLVAYNGERFNGGFDLPFLRTRYSLQGLDWPFDGIPYADILPLIRKRFNTTTDGEERNDLATAYETLADGELSELDPFSESDEVVDAFEAGDFEDLVTHNIADIHRTEALASLAERFCGKSEFDLKSLTPSARDPDLSRPR
jgi:DNA polymerase III epsilon subunit-like protein